MILIVAKPGALRDGLQALAQALPGFDGVVNVDSAQGAYCSVEKDPIKLVLMEAASFGDSFASIVRGIKEIRPEIHCITIIKSHKQQKIAEAAGADRIYLTGFPAAILFEDVQQLQQGCAVPLSEYEHSP